LDLILFIPLGVLIIQLATFFHELGHAIPAVLFSNDKVKMVLGNKRTNKSLKINKLSISIRSFEPFTGFVCYNAKNIKKEQIMIICIGGPITSLLIGIISFILSNLISSEMGSELFIFSSIYNVFLFLISIIPITYPNWIGKLGGHLSDGYKAMRVNK
jgi:hypothetical protein